MSDHSTTIQLHGPVASQIAHIQSTGGRFLAMRLGNDISVYLPGYDAEAAAYARALAAQLVTAAEQIEALTVVPSGVMCDDRR